MAPQHIEYSAGRACRWADSARRRRRPPWSPGCARASARSAPPRCSTCRAGGALLSARPPEDSSHAAFTLGFSPRQGA
jgi:hypothetical protein